MAKSIENEGRDTQVQIQCAELEVACKGLCESVSAMEERLRSVLQLAEPSAVDESKKDNPLVPHAEFLRARVSVITNAVANLDDLRRRLEL